jgi:hypothetical protein
LVLKANGGAGYVVGTIARPPHGTPDTLPPVSTKDGNSGHQSSSSGTANAHVEMAEVVWPLSLEDLAQDLLQAGLQGHAALGERAPLAPMLILAHIADRATDPSTPPGLSFLKRALQSTHSLRTTPRKKKIDIIIFTPLSRVFEV